MRAQLRSAHGRAALAGAALILIAGTGYLDAVAGRVPDLLVIHLAAVIAATAAGGAWPGAVAAATGSLAVGWAGAAAGAPWWAVAWDAAAAAAVLGAGAAVVRRLDAMTRRQEELVFLDPLTGLVNRAAFHHAADREIARSRRYRRPFTVVTIDVDGFATTNERLGPEAGDALLRCAGSTIKDQLRASDLVARTGADEFSIILPETGLEGAEQVLEKLRQRLLRAMLENGWAVTFSMGVTTFTSPPPSANELLARSQITITQAKAAGRDSVRHEVVP